MIGGKLRIVARRTLFQALVSRLARGGRATEVELHSAEQRMMTVGKKSSELTGASLILGVGLSGRRTMMGDLA